MVRIGKETGGSQGRCRCRADLAPTGKKSQIFALLGRHSSSVIDVTGQPFDPICRGPVVKEGLLSDCLTPKDGAPLVVPKRRWLAANLRCITSQKSDDLSYAAAEARNQAKSDYPTNHCLLCKIRTHCLSKMQSSCLV